MVRIYANVLGLSKSLARSGFVGHEARSLAPFAASFTRAQDLFDFVDAGDKKEGADYKIRGMARPVRREPSADVIRNVPSICR